MSKRAAEEILKQLSNCSNFRHVIFWYYNVAGADPDGEIGEFHQPETHLVPLILDAITGRRDNITVFGTDYDTPDGTAQNWCRVLNWLVLNWGGSQNIHHLST